MGDEQKNMLHGATIQFLSVNSGNKNRQVGPIHQIIYKNETETIQCA
jgi:hypothetical protein